MNNNIQSAHNPPAVSYMQNQPDIIANLFNNHQLQMGSSLESSYNTTTARSMVPNNSLINANNSNISTEPSSILITNSFAHQPLSSSPEHQKQQDQHLANVQNKNFNANSIRIITAVPNGLQDTHHRHVFNINNNIEKDSNQIQVTEALEVHPQLPVTQQQQQYILQQQQALSHQQHSLPVLITQSHNFSQQHYPAQLQITSPTSSLTQSFYLPTDTTTTTTAKILSVNNSVPPVHTITTPTASSTVMLDRINICINNHYTDGITSNTSVISPSTSATMLSTAPSQQPSPIIPAINHRVVIEQSNGLQTVACASNEPGLIIDEPDSTTTTPHTPPKTPENSPSGTTSSIQSPTTTDITTKHSFINFNTNDDENDVDFISINNSDNNEVPDDQKLTTRKNLMPLTPITSPRNTPPQVEFSNGEDVFIKRQDGRYYLGTVINNTEKEFLIRFDDKSEIWCKIDEIHKFGGENKSSSEQSQMCVACKRVQSSDVVEVCERCGRGYHRSCSDETEPGSSQWMCKRCFKPMKILENQNQKLSTQCQFPYYTENLTWDEKHEVNEEQIYCYCRTSGRFDENMLQCCKCKNWFHTHCVNNFKYIILRGDGFFVFCCNICNNGEEFLRRIEMNWVDLLHLCLYNLSVNHKHPKLYHLYDDIISFILEKRNMLPIPKEWIKLSRSELKEQVKKTFEANTEKFICGREKKMENYYSLRNSGPLTLPKLNIKRTDVLNDDFLIHSKKLTLYYSTEDLSTTEKLNRSRDIPQFLRNDVYEFHAEDTSEDEIPIKHIIDKVKKNLNDEKMHITNDLDSNQIDVKNKQTTNVDKLFTSKTEKTSRKRKAFTLSNSYKEIAAEVAAKRYESSRICDSSSDENSSSSRSTSLDLIIPPPKNFLGLNNPFLMVTPKKNDSNHKQMDITGRTSTIIKNRVFNTNTLDFCSKLAALKSAGLLTNLSGMNLAKAAGQPRTVRTIKRRLSAKDITIGPNQEVRRRRTRRLNTSVEVINTTTINPIPSSFFPTHAKDFSVVTQNNRFHHNNSTTSSAASTPPGSTLLNVGSLSRIQLDEKKKFSHGRRLRDRPQKNTTDTNLQDSISNSNGFSNHSTSMDLTTSVNKYFGVTNRIESGEKFSIHAKRQLPNGQIQYYIYWGESGVAEDSINT